MGAADLARCPLRGTLDRSHLNVHWNIRSWFSARTAPFPLRSHALQYSAEMS